MKTLLFFAGISICMLHTNAQTQTNNNSLVQFVFTSDVHYGIARKAFRGAENVDAHIVNMAMVKQINSLPDLILPADNGVQAGKKIGAIDFLAETGDIANRMEPPYQNAAASWKQFTIDFIEGVTILDKLHHPTAILPVPGNHDASNAIGFYRPMQPLNDASSMAGIYNLVFHPLVLKTKETYNYQTDKINYSKDIGGIHFVFINIWPDSATRIWMDNDLKAINIKTPVIIFAHDPPDGDPKHFTNPNGNHDINATDKFENLVPEVYKDDIAVTPLKTTIEQNGFVSFLKTHANIKAYFHGHNNWNEYYVYTGPDNDIRLPVFRVDSPMKGRLSASDETKLSFQFVTIDTGTKVMTVRECLWNKDPDQSMAPAKWGSSQSVSLK
jgi:hypothetical protein